MNNAAREFLAWKEAHCQASEAEFQLQLASGRPASMRTDHERAKEAVRLHNIASQNLQAFLAASARVTSS